MSFRVTILGSSGAVPAYGRYPSSQLIEISNNHLLIDCGEGAQLRLAELHANLQRIDAIFISHLHGDHYLGLTGLLFTMHLHRREKELHLFSHKGLDEILVEQMRYSRSALNFKVVMHFLHEGIQELIYENKHITVESIPLKHKIPCSGFLIREKPKPPRLDKERLPSSLQPSQLAALKRGEDVADQSGKIMYSSHELTLPPKKSRSYAYCSDTRYDESLADRIHGIDLLYHEATFGNDHADKAIETLHSTAAEAGQIARKACVGKLLLGHFSARYREPDELLSEARRVFENTYLARDLDVIDIDE